MGKPVVDTEYLANKHKPPVGKPVVNKEELENRSKKSEETEAPSVKAEAAAPVEKQPEKKRLQNQLRERQRNRQEIRAQTTLKPMRDHQEILSIDQIIMTTAAMATATTATT